MRTETVYLYWKELGVKLFRLYKCSDFWIQWDGKENRYNICFNVSRTVAVLPEFNPFENRDIVNLRAIKGKYTASATVQIPCTTPKEVEKELEKGIRELERHALEKIKEK